MAVKGWGVFERDALGEQAGDNGEKQSQAGRLTAISRLRTSLAEKLPPRQPTGGVFSLRVDPN